MGWTAPRFEKDLIGPRWYIRPSTTERGGSEDAGYYAWDRFGKERVPGSRLRCEWEGGAAQAIRAAALAELYRARGLGGGRDRSGRPHHTRRQYDPAQIAAHQLVELASGPDHEAFAHRALANTADCDALARLRGIRPACTH